MIIAFTSKVKEAGKNTAAGFVRELCEEQGVPYLQEAFSDRMKLLVAESLGMIVTTGDDAEKEYDRAEVIKKVDNFKLKGGVETISGDEFTFNRKWIEGREFIINLAEGARTLFGPLFWVDQMFNDWNFNHVRRDGIVAITDLSYNIEADTVHECGGTVIEIVNSRASGSRLRAGLGLSDENIDTQIYNEGTLDEFRDATQALVNIIMHGESVRK